MKIIQVHNYYQQAGGEDSVVASEKLMLQKYGNIVVPFYKTNDDIPFIGKDKKVLASNFFKLLSVSLKTIWNHDIYAEFRGILRNEKPDIVHCHNTFPKISPSIYWACFKENVPVVQTLHNYRLLCPSANLFFNGEIYESSIGKLFPWQAVKDRVYRNSFAGTLVVALMLFFHRIIGTWKNKISIYIALTEFHKEKMIEGNLPKDLIMVKPNFITEESEPVKPYPLRIDMERPVFLFVGRLSPEKGCRVLLRAWQQIEKKFGNNPLLLIVGDGPERVSLEELRDSLSLKETRFLGLQSRTQVKSLMARADLLIVPSLWYEGFPMTIVEALNRGLPVAASNIGSMQSIIVEGMNGFKFKPADISDIASCMKSVLESDDELREIRTKLINKPNMAYRSSGNLKSLLLIYKKAIEVMN